jgi:hypothetical protein
MKTITIHADLRTVRFNDAVGWADLILGDEAEQADVFALISQLLNRGRLIAAMELRAAAMALGYFEFEPSTANVD